MRSAARTRRRLVGVGLVSAVVAVAASLAPGASATSAKGTSAAADAHKCLVMTGSGDAAFTHAFNPYTGPTLNGNIMKGAIYEPLLVATVAGGGHVYPWLASSWKWSNANKTLTLQIVKNAKWSDGQAADAGRRGLQPDRGQAGQGHGHHRPDASRHEHPVGQAQRPERRRDHAQDARLAVHRGAAEPPARRAAARLVEGQEGRDLHEPEPRRLGPVQPDRPPDEPGHRVQQEPELLGLGRAQDAVPRVPGDGLERRGAARDPERQGRLDAQLRAERRVRLRVQGSGALPRLLLHDGVPDLAHVRRHAVPVQPRAAAPGDQHVDQPLGRLQAR